MDYQPSITIEGDVYSAPFEYVISRKFGVALRKKRNAERQSDKRLSYKWSEFGLQPIFFLVMKFSIAPRDVVKGRTTGEL